MLQHYMQNTYLAWINNHILNMDYDVDTILKGDGRVGCRRIKSPKIVFLKKCFSKFLYSWVVWGSSASCRSGIHSIRFSPAAIRIHIWHVAEDPWNFILRCWDWNIRMQRRCEPRKGSWSCEHWKDKMFVAWLCDWMVHLPYITLYGEFCHRYFSSKLYGVDCWSKIHMSCLSYGRHRNVLAQ